MVVVVVCVCVCVVRARVYLPSSEHAACRGAKRARLTVFAARGGPQPGHKHRARVQAISRRGWLTKVPVLRSADPARLVLALGESFVARNMLR